MSEKTLTRRGLLEGAAGIAVLAAAGCTSESTNSPGGNAGPDTPPSQIPFGEAAEPDLPGDGEHIPDAYFTYPTNPGSYAKVPISEGSTVSLLTPLNGPSVTKSKSPWWQNIEETLGVNLKMTLVPGAELGTKQQAMISSGDIPDIAIVNPNNVPLGAMEEYFADLGPFLGGSAAEEYPALAAFPSVAWRTPTINGTLFGVPQPRIPAYLTLSVRQDLMDEAGITVSVDSGQDLLDLFAEVTDPRHNRWALGQDPLWLMWLVMEMHDIPTFAGSWFEDDGKFTNQYEAEEIKDCLSIVATAWKEGYLHPDSTTPDTVTWFGGGIASFVIADFVSVPAYLSANPGIDAGLVPTPTWDGGGLARKQLGTGAGGNYASFKKASDSRIRELLQLADYVAAPMGTHEYLAVNYGREGDSYTFTGSDPILTDAGQVEAGVRGALQYVSASSLTTLYNPGNADFTRRQHEYLTTVMEDTYFHAAIGLYSPTNMSPEGSKAGGDFQDAMADILLGREPVSSYDDAIKAWREGAGDKIRSEYEDAWAKAH